MTEISRKTFLLEVGVEEVPARMAAKAAGDLMGLLSKELEALRLVPESMENFVTPRRLIVLASGLPERQEDIVVEKRGPAARVAFDADGNPTKAGVGFARSQGLDVSKLERREVNGVEYLFACKDQQGEAAATLLPPVLEKILQAMRFPKSMRWGSSKQSFVRPVHWIVALLGGETVPFEFGGVVAGNTTRAHRFMGSREPLLATGAEQFFKVLRDNFVLVDPEERKQKVREELAALEAAKNVQVLLDEELLDEVANLVEYPSVAGGTFNEKFLQMPPEVLITSMKYHQKFFAVNEGGKLAARFAMVSNTKARDESLVVRGNERVLAARLEDALFFFKEDRKRPLAEFVADLGGQTFLKGLGSMRSKSGRVSALAEKLAKELFSSGGATAARAGTLCKADLATQMVFEFPELQGVMGREYALAGGETGEVATAIFEHYLPGFAGDVLPSTEAGLALSLADRLDLLAGCFHLRLIPTATKDPYALRRAALGCVRMLAEKQLPTPLGKLLDLAIANYGETITGDPAELREEIMEFIQGRLRNWLTADHATEVVDAVLAAGYDMPRDVRARCCAAEALRGRPDYEDLILPFKRVINITRKEKVEGFDASLLVDQAEKDLWAAFCEVRKKVEEKFEEGDCEAVLSLLLELKPPIDRYFDDVLVMCDDEALRSNRLGMLGQIGRLFLRFADFTRILV